MFVNLFVHYMIKFVFYSYKIQGRKYRIFSKYVGPNNVLSNFNNKLIRKKIKLDYLRSRLYLVHAFWAAAI